MKKHILDLAIVLMIANSIYNSIMYKDLVWVNATIAWMAVLVIKNGYDRLVKQIRQYFDGQANFYEGLEKTINETIAKRKNDEDTHRD